MEAADYTIMNDGSLKELGEQLEFFYTPIKTVLNTL
jgi:hypothetical protein